MEQHYYKIISFFHVRTGPTNNLLTGEVIAVSSSNDATLNCTFLPGFTGSAHCTVQYGTDPTYMNLPYSAESTETGTAGDSVSVVLRERLNSSTVYYYTVSAVSGDVTVTILAPSFVTGKQYDNLCIHHRFRKQSGSVEACEALPKNNNFAMILVVVNFSKVHIFTFLETIAEM